MKSAEADATWLVEVATNELDKNSDKIPPEYINLTSLKDLDAEIGKVAAIIAEKIDWLPLDEDFNAPFVSDYSPSETLDVDIHSNVKVVIKEHFPSGGIDKESIKITINDFDITDESDISGDGFEYKLKWKPSIIVYDTYE